MSAVRLYVSAAVAASTGALFGYTVGFVGGLLVLPSFLHHFHLDTLPAVDLARSQSLIVSSWIVGAFFGVPSGIPICSRHGRKACLVFSAVLYILGTILQTANFGSALWLFEIGRFLNGYGVGAGTLVSPI
jgi:MFS family permease